MLTNAGPETVTFTLPGEQYGKTWQVAVDTALASHATSRSASW